MSDERFSLASQLSALGAPRTDAREPPPAKGNGVPAQASATRLVKSWRLRLQWMRLFNADVTGRRQAVRLRISSNRHPPTGGFLFASVVQSKKSWQYQNMALSAKQRTFVDEYLVDLNATQAAIRAGYSKNTAGAIGGELFQKPEIQEAIQGAMQRRAERTEITQDKVLADIEVIKRDAMKLIKRDAMKGKIDKDGDEVMVNHTAALKACELQGRHLRMWNDKLDITASVSIADAIRERIAKRSVSHG